MSFKNLLRLLTAGLFAACQATTVWAGNWPEHPVHVVVVYSPGGVSDTVTRAISEKLSQNLGAAFVVENKAGAGGTIGMGTVAKAKPDGFTIGFSSVSPLALSPLFSQVSYDPRKDITPVASVMVSPVVLLGTQAFSGKTLNDVIAQSKANPGSLRWATSGHGSLGHLMLEQFQHTAGIKLTHIPYKGSAQQKNDALGAQFELTSMNLSAAVLSHVKNGELHALAMAAPSRVDALPDVPTLTELGYEKANMMSKFGFFAPAGTPKEIVNALNKAINEAVASPDIQKLLTQSSNISLTGTPESFANEIAHEYDDNRNLIESAGLKLE